MTNRCVYLRNSWIEDLDYVTFGRDLRDKLVDWPAGEWRVWVWVPDSFDGVLQAQILPFWETAGPRWVLLRDAPVVTPLAGQGVLPSDELALLALRAVTRWVEPDPDQDTVMDRRELERLQANRAPEHRLKPGAWGVFRGAGRHRSRGR